MFPSKNPGIKTPLKETSIVSNDFCRICRIDFKTSGRSKINVFGKNNKENIIISSVVRCYTTEYDGSIADNLPEVPTRSFAIFEGVRATGKIMGKMQQGPKNSVGRVPLAQEMTEVLHERFSGCCVSTTLFERLKPFRRKQKFKHLHWSDWVINWHSKDTAS